MELTPPGKRDIQQMKQALDAADAANRAKSQFLANISHEIRTPLNGIIGLTELILETQLSNEQREYLALIKTSADSLRTIISDVLDFSKIEAGKLELEPVPFSLRGCVETLRTFLPQAFDKGLQVAWYASPAIPDALLGDPVRLRQILVNLVGNAIKFTEEGEVVVKVELEAWEEGAIQLHFFVRDTGIGIPSDKQRSIFEAFEQADVSTSRRFGGTGLGLAISADLVESMGGRIWVESEEGVGSTFHFTARFALAPELEERTSPSGEEHPICRSLRVLLAEDNPVNQLMAARMLEKNGHSVVLAGDGIEAVAAWEREPFDLILMDVLMPNLDGFGAAALIRAGEKGSGRRIPIVAVTANALKGDRERCLAADMDGYVSKPIRWGSLLAEISRTLSL